MSEIEREDTEVDPVLTSRHVGPAARKRQADQKDRYPEEQERASVPTAPETRRASKRQKGNATASGTGSPANAGAVGGATATKNGNGNVPGK